MERWAGRVAVITGASCGIGAAITRALLKHGMTVVGCARSVDRVQAIANEPEIKSTSGKLVAVQCDITKEDEILEMFKQVEQLGGVDVMINNAGCGSDQANLIDGSTDQWRMMVDVNIMGLSICTREAVKSMRKKGADGHIIHISSMSGHRHTSGSFFYAATKFAVRALTEGLRRELRNIKSNIRVSELSPGLVETEFQVRAQRDEAKAKKLYQSVGECLQAHDMADCVVYMLSAPQHVEVHDILVRPTGQKM